MEGEDGPAVQKARSSFSEKNVHSTTFLNFTNPCRCSKQVVDMYDVDKGTCMKVTSDKVTHEPLS